MHTYIVIYGNDKQGDMFPTEQSCKLSL